MEHGNDDNLVPRPASPPPPPPRYRFPRWTNRLRSMFAVGVVGGVVYATGLVRLGFSPKATAVGYQPQQPIPYSHALHAGKLGIDCRYCHTSVENASFAALPPTQTCMNCHATIKTDSPLLKPLRDSWETGKPVEWTRVHSLPNYAYFNHGAHVTHGVSCVECHGRVDQMDTVKQVQPLSMSWCLECHRDPAGRLRPKDQVTNLGWLATEDPIAKAKSITDPESAKRIVGEFYKSEYHIQNPAYMQACSTCHR